VRSDAVGGGAYRRRTRPVEPVMTPSVNITDQRHLVLPGGEHLGFDGLIIATGVEARRG
jgi:hypothetical protein